MNKLSLYNFAKIREAHFNFGDLTIFIGPQATGKTLVLELIKLIEDKVIIGENLNKYGYSWENNKEFLSLFFGEGLDIVWNKDETRVIKDGNAFKLNPRPKGRRNDEMKKEKVFYIPAHRVITLEAGWPKPFMAYSPGDPYVLKQFSETIRQVLERMKSKIFPIEGRMKKNLRDSIDNSIFWGGELSSTRRGMRKRIVIKVQDREIPIMGWSAGQREFVPLLVGLYNLLPSGRVEKVKDIDIVIIEEPEMGLHPKALESFMLTILDLLRRGYKVFLSTHSAVLLDLIWTIKAIKQNKNKAKEYFKALFNIKQPYFDNAFESAVEKTYKIFYFKPETDNSVSIKDISDLDNFENEDIADWGGFLSFNTRANEIVAEIMSNLENQE